MPAYKVVFISAGIGMLLSLVWFWFGRRQLKGIRLPAAHQTGPRNVSLVLLFGVVIGIPAVLRAADHRRDLLQYILMALFIIPAIMLFREGVVESKVSRDKVVAMLVIFAFNVLFWMFFEQAGRLVQLPRREDRQPRHRHAGPVPGAGRHQRLPGVLVPVGELGGDHRARADPGLAVGEDGPQQPDHPAQVRPRTDLQRPRLPAADGGVVEYGRRRRQDPVLDAVRRST